jgi:glycosyltransferase involved in cell wall biosynthesis
MRISCVLGPFLPAPPILGGAVERVWFNLCREFARSGHEVTLISRRHPDLANEETVDGVRHIRVSSADAPKSRLLYRLLDVAYAARVCAILPLSDVTITNSVALPLFIPRRRAGKICVSVGRFPKGQMGIYRRADRLQAVSRAVARAIVEQSPSVAGRVKVIPNCLATTFSLRRSGERGERDKDILYVGRIAREKGLEPLMRSFLSIEGHADWRLILLGPSDAAAGGDGAAYRAELEALASGAQGRVVLEKPIYDEAALFERMRRAEIFVYPSLSDTGESFGMAPLEAMACGCAVIVSNLECFHDYLVDGGNGLTFENRDHSERGLARNLMRLMDAPELRNRLGLCAIMSSSSFDVEAVAAHFIDDFVELQGADQASKSCHDGRRR